MKRLQILAVVGTLLACTGSVSAQKESPNIPGTSASSPGTPAFPWLRFSAAVNVENSALQELLPRLQAYWTGRNDYDRAAFRRLITPTFSFYSEVIVSRPCVGAEALLGISDYPDRPDGTFRTTGRLLTVQKFFAKPGRSVVYLDEALSWVDTRSSARREYGDVPVTITWHWKQTWVKQGEDWKLASVVNRHE